MVKVLNQRRKFIKIGLALPISLPACLLLKDARASELQSTANCKTPAVSTRRQTAGPFFTPNSPLRSNFREGSKAGKPLDLTGFVKTPDCRPVANAIVELWHTDAQGRYDNEGYTMRGHQFTDANGHFLFETIVPGRYPSRTLHYHVTIAPVGTRPLTTQLYFPNDQGNDKDWIFDKRLLLDIGEDSGVETGHFEFIIETG
jgi:protocatechuate 3,4-dioxygenase beta subunit